MKTTLNVVTLVAVLCAQFSSAAAIEITSNDFNAFATAVSTAPAGSTFTFDLGANSTIHFTHPIGLSKQLNFVGNNAVTFDGGGTTKFFSVSSASSFSGFTFQNGYSLNVAGAIDSSNQMTIRDSVFLNNTAGNVGGAIYGTANIYGSLFVGNHAGNVGGAVSADNNSDRLLIENSTFYNNSAHNTGGAINIGGLGTIRNSTVFNNSAGNLGGGVNNQFPSTVTIESSLLAGNIGGDLNSDDAIPLFFHVKNSIIGSPVWNNLPDGTNGNKVGDGNTIAGFPISALLGPLANNGGLTQTMALLDYNGIINPAINAGSNPDNLLYDQRGAFFLRQAGAGVDIGAFERAAPEPSAGVLAGVGLATLLAFRRRHGRRRQANN